VKVTLLGHATVVVETGPMRILMDPVLHDPFENGMVVSCPKRVIDLDRLGPIDVVVLSHRHPDHFDLPSLDRLSRHCQVVCANDPLLFYALRALGFEHVTPMDPQSAMPSPQAELFPTRSENTAVRECGMVIRDDSAVFWNQAISLPDLLMDFTIYEAADSEDAAKRRIDHEISQLREARG
jgi:hypothetical protein